MLREFKAFALRGNVIELAVAVVLGIAFNAVIQSFANDVLMNLIAAVFGKPDFSNLVVTINGAAIGYGATLTAIVNFVLIALALFFVVRTLNRLMQPKGAPAEPPTTRECPYCRTAIPVTATRCAACTSAVEAQPA